jgi:hypothetical protein
MLCYVRIEGVPVQGRYLAVHVSPWGMAAFSFDPAVEHIQVYLPKAPDWSTPADRVPSMGE